MHAVGVILYEMLVGERPYRRRDVNELLVVIATEAPPAPREKNPQIHPDVEAIILRCLEKDPARRFANGRALHEPLAAVREGRALPDATARLSTHVSRATNARAPSDRPKREDVQAFQMVLVAEDAAREALAVRLQHRPLESGRSGSRPWIS